MKENENPLARGIEGRRRKRRRQQKVPLPAALVL